MSLQKITFQTKRLLQNDFSGVLAFLLHVEIKKEGTVDSG